MKMLLLAVMLWSGRAYAATDVIQAPIFGASVPVAVSVSTSQYTNVTSSSTRISELSAVLIDNPSTNSATVHGHVGSCFSTTVSTSAVKGPIEIPPANSGGFIALSEGQCLWLVSRNTSAESVTVQGVKQTR